MDNQSPGTLVEHFSSITDPRVDRTKCHKLTEETVYGGRGRIEVRRYYATSDCEWVRKKADWKGCKR